MLLERLCPPVRRRRLALSLPLTLTSRKGSGGGPAAKVSHRRQCAVTAGGDPRERRAVAPVEQMYHYELVPSPCGFFIFVQSEATVHTWERRAVSKETSMVSKEQSVADAAPKKHELNVR